MDIVDGFMYIIGVFVFLPIFLSVGYLLATCIPEKTEGKKGLFYRIAVLVVSATSAGCFAIGLALLVNYRFNDIIAVSKTAAVAFTVVGSILTALSVIVGVAIKIKQKKKGNRKP